MKTVETEEREKAIVVGLVRGSQRRSHIEEYLDELMLLADTAGVDVCHKIIQERDRLDPATYIGSGKAREIGELVEKEGITAVIFDDDLSPVQLRNLEKTINAKIIDRSGLILDIFAIRAKSKEAMTQVELAQLQYMLPRLTRQWTHLSRQYGGVGTKGPGETQIETDRRAIRRRISLLKEKLDAISTERIVQRKHRKESTRVALVGYTNAGKSTLLKLLSGADVLIENRLFATLDTTVRKVELNSSKSILLSDTVGFIRKLPTHLVASFKSTLAEAIEADIVLHVIDISHPQFEEHIEVVVDTLDELGASGKPTIMVFNKIDRLKDRAIIAGLQSKYENAVFISAARGINVSGLKSKILEAMEHGEVEQTLIIKQEDYRMIAGLHGVVEIVRKEYEGNSVKVTIRVNQKNSDRLKKILAGKSGVVSS